MLDPLQAEMLIVRMIVAVDGSRGLQTDNIELD